MGYAGCAHRVHTYPETHISQKVLTAYSVPLILLFSSSYIHYTLHYILYTYTTLHLCKYAKVFLLNHPHVYRGHSVSFLSMADTTRASPKNPINFSFQQTMLRIKDPTKTVPFYTNNFGFKLLHSYHFPQWKFSLYFMGVLEVGREWPEPNTKESEVALWDYSGTVLEFTHNHGTEDDASFAVNTGNVEPYRGFGHIAMMTRDVYAASTELEASGVRFQKRPDEGRMKGIAFCLDPDGYWIELVRRSEDSSVMNKYTLAQTMLRVKDPVKSLAFYRDTLGMSLLKESHFSDFSLYFLAQLPAGTVLPDKDSTEGDEFIRKMFPQVLELTHNHGTEMSPEFSYHNGNDQDKGQLRGFGHIGFLVDDLSAACALLDTTGCKFKKRPEDGNMKQLAFALDPDNYWVEIIQRNGLRM